MSQPIDAKSLQADDYEDRILWLKQSAKRKWFPSSSATRQRVYEKLFSENTTRNLFHGVFKTFDEAQASAPLNRPKGYDNAESAALYFGHMQADPYDYPALLWLERSFAAGMNSVFDVGGHIGIKFYAFREHLQFPDELNWRVCDVPAVISRGKTAAIKRDPAKQLSFTSNYSDVEGFDVLFASGVIQYLPMTVSQWLAPVAGKPKRIIFNTSAIHPTESYFTLNSIGTAYCPYRVTAHAEFLTQLEQLGYRMIDQWKTPGKGALHLPLQESYSIAEYSGFVFDRK
jgi:putative methyltransferase (TIGR04325 family)